MPQHWIRKYLPTRDSISGQKSLGPVRHLLLKPELWHLGRHAVSRAFFIGLFCAFLPMPFQMVVAALLAVLARGNVPISVGLVWITNPFTIGPFFFFAYKLGALMLGSDTGGLPEAMASYETETLYTSWQWLGAQFAAIWRPLILGCLVCGCVSGLIGATAAWLLWPLHVIRRWMGHHAKHHGTPDSASGDTGAESSITSRTPPGRRGATND